jgi:transposase
MTDAEWALIARRMPARCHLGRPSLFSLPDVSGGRCRRNFRHTQQFRAISMLGAIPQDGKKSLRLWFGKRVVSLAASPNQQQRYVPPANVQDCHGAVPLLERVRCRFPKLQHVFADRIYRGEQLPKALSHCGPWTIEIVERPPDVKGFQLLSRCWVVERTFAWCGRCRRLAKDFEGSAATEVAWILVAHIN